MKKKAILYNSNFEKLATLAQYLVHDDWEILSAGDTAKFLQENNIPYTYIKQLEYNPNSDDSFISLYHSVLAAGRDLLSSSFSTDFVVNLVCINVEPVFHKLNDFLEVEKSYNSIELKEMALLASAAKNYMNVLVLCDSADYQDAIVQMKNDSISTEFRLYLAAKALNQISACSAANALSISQSMDVNSCPPYLMIPFKFAGRLHHGSNDHQSAFLYSLNDKVGVLSGMKKIQGKEMNFNLYENCFAAWKAISIFTKILKSPFTVDSVDCNNYPFTTQFTPAATSVFTIGIKNSNPIGASLGGTLLESFRKTYSCEPDSFNGSTFGCSSVVDGETARELVKIDFRAIIAPDFTKEAREIFSERKDMRLVIVSRFISGYYEMAAIDGGIMLQEPDSKMFTKLSVVTRKRPSQAQVDSMAFGMLVAMTCKSDAAVVVNDFSTVGISAGNTSRKRAVRYALQDASEYFENNQNNNLISKDRNSEILISDSVIYFDEYVKKLADVGIKAIIQTGGVDCDAEFIQYCNERDISMIFTGIQHLSV